MDLRNLSDSEFRKAMDALPSYDYELALEIEHLSSISEVPEDKWEAFINFYKEYSNPNKNTNQNKKFLKELVTYSIIVILIFTLSSQSSPYLFFFFSIGKVYVAISLISRIWLRYFKSNNLFFIQRVLNNYFLGWESIYKYKGKTTRVEFWHFYFFDLFIKNLLLFIAGYSILREPHGLFETDVMFNSISGSYNVLSTLVSIPLIIRRLRDIGKRNKILWFFLSLIPIYGYFIVAKPSFNNDEK